MPAETPQPVACAEPGPAAAGFQHSRTCNLPVSDVVWRLRETIEAADLWILHEVDPQLLLRRDGYAISPARQILFFHPRYVVRMLQADPCALLEAPLKFVVLQQPDGSTAIRWFDPAAAFARYGNPALTELGKELADLCETIAAIDTDQP
jgi:uncharacterized protein (DUF302 family)